MKNWTVAMVLGGLVSVGSLQADDAARIRELEQKLESLEKRYQTLEKRLEGTPDSSGDKAKAPPLAVAGADGFALQSKDGDFKISLKGLLQFDSRWYVNDGGIGNNDTFLLRRARPIIEGNLYRDFEFRLVPDFGGTGAPQIFDAVINYKPWNEFQVQVGKFKVPVGLEALQSDSQMWFIERSLLNNLVPNRDMGIQVHGQILNGTAQYAVGLFNGTGDNRNTTNFDFDDDKDVAGRLFFHPFRKAGIGALENFGLGVGASYGNQEGINALPTGAGANYVTHGQQTFFSYRQPAAATAANPFVTPDGDHWRISPQAYYYCGPFGLMAEYAINSQRLRAAGGGTTTWATLDNRAWHISGSWVLTGENGSYAGVKPSRPYGSGGGWGAVELVARYAGMEVEKGAFPLFATGGSARRAQSIGGGVNWWLNKNIRISLDYDHTEFDGGDGTNPVVREGEDAILSRFQLSF